MYTTASTIIYENNVELYKKKYENYVIAGQTKSSNNQTKVKKLVWKAACRLKEKLYQ